uniref:Protein MEMO1 n=2 Tax=Hirondellea gigas TaxID=1518452 RepID=A0A2P2I8U6_9CRUS
MSSKQKERAASHAGSWYSDEAPELERQLDRWLSQVEVRHGPARAIIAPHAGYRYSGAVSAYAFRQISPVLVKRIFILGPSHHVRLGGCALTSLREYATPLYSLVVDQQVCAELYATGHFETMSVTADEEEHSIEMMLPFIARVMDRFRDQVTIVPILVGSLTVEREAMYGRVMSHYLADPTCLFVISSDFCHWGQRFRYTPQLDRNSFNGPIYRWIQELDQQGMDLIEAQSTSGFSDYLKKTGNTICGRHPISVLLQAMSYLQRQQQQLHQQSSSGGSSSGGSSNSSSPGPPILEMKLKFLQYAQSNNCSSNSDSSVSYAAAALTMH